MPSKVYHDDNADEIGNHSNQTQHHTQNDFTNHAFNIDDLSQNNGQSPENSQLNRYASNHGGDEVFELNDDSKEDFITNSVEDEPEDSYRSLVPFCLVFGLGSLLSQGISMYLSSQITVIEKAFGLSSTKSGFLLSANDIGFVVSVLFASHFLKNHHIPRVLAGCILLFGISGILTSMPHFISGEHTSMTSVSHNASDTSNDNFLCVPGSAESDNSSKIPCAGQEGTGEGGSKVPLVVAVIAGMMVIQGVAKGPRQPLGNIYIDNNSVKTNTGFYLGILTAFTIFGPFLAITAGGLFNKVPVDLKETSIKPEDPRWIGAWWLGFIVFGACAVLISVPIFFFPASLRKKPVEQNNKSAEYINASNLTENKKSFLKKATGMPRSILRVFSQPIYVAHVISTVTYLMAVIGLASFGPKYIENQFQIPTWKANIILGAEKLTTTSIGTLAGGIISRRLKLGLTGCVKMVLFVRCFGIVTQAFNFLFGCDHPDIAGFNYKTSFAEDLSCHCSSTKYLPVCADGLTFFSPCYAGCQTEVNNEYTDCTASISGKVELGMCDTGCNFLVPYIAVNAISALVQTTAIAPSIVIVLRSVKEKDRAMAVGLQSFLASLLVFLPAPIMFGKVFDSICLVWNVISSCAGESLGSDTTGSCSIYDVKDMRIKFVSIDIGLKAASLISTLFTLYFVMKKAREDNKEKIIKPPVPQPRTSLTPKE